jgi:hypothetical protein
MLCLWPPQTLCIPFLLTLLMWGCVCRTREWQSQAWSSGWVSPTDTEYSAVITMAHCKYPEQPIHYVLKENKALDIKYDHKSILYLGVKILVSVVIKKLLVLKTFAIMGTTQRRVTKYLLNNISRVRWNPKKSENLQVVGML